MSRKKKRTKRKTPDRAAALEQARTAMMKRLKGTGKDIKVLTESDAGERMSTALLTLIEPYRTPDETLEMVKKLCVIGMLAWNATVMESGKGAEMINTLATEIGANDEADMEAFSQLMITLMLRKMALFPHNQRRMIDYQVVSLPDKYHVSVVSTPPPDMDPEELVGEGK